MRSFAAAIVLVVLSSAHVRGSSPPQAAPQSPPSQATPPVQPDLAAGKVVFEGHCAFCHGMDGSGGRGPSLRRSKLAHAAGEEALKSVIENGIQPDMPEAWYLSTEEILGRCRAGSHLRKGSSRSSYGRLRPRLCRIRAQRLLLQSDRVQARSHYDH